MTDSPRRTQNRSRGENYYPISKRNIGGTAMKSRHSRLPVSDMVKMYTPPNSTAIGNRTAPVARKWPPVATAGSPASSKPPPTAPKPGGLSSHAVNGARPATAPRPFQSENKPILPKWKMDIENRKAAASQNDKQEENRRPSWGQKRDEPEEKQHETGQPWNQSHKQQDNAEPSRPKWGQQRNEQKEEESNLPAWKLELLRAKQETEKTSENALKSTSHEDSNSTRSVSNGPWRGAKPPPHPNVSAKPSTVPWSQRNRHSAEFPNPPPPDAEKPTDNLAPKRSNPQSRSFAGYQAMPRPTIEKSSGSFGSSSPKMTRKNNEAPAALSTDTSPQRRVNSFLHTGPKLPGPKPNATNGPPPPPPSGVKPQKPNGVPRRLPIPEDKYYEPPPLKTSKPPNVVLPSKGRKKLSLPSLPGSLFSRPSLPSRDLRAPPPAGGRDLPAPPPSDARNHPPPPLGGRDLPAPPPTGARDVPFPLPIGARDLPLPPPGGARGPHSPNLPPLPSRPTDLPPDLPSRPLPSPLPGKISMPLPVPPIEDDIYDDPVEALPPRPQMIPPPMVKRKSSGLIPTWSDEEDEAVYDETPDEPSARPLIPVGFPMPGAPPQIPEDGDEMYEDVEEYMRLKKIQLQQQQQPTDGSVPGGKDKKEKDKKKKDSEKREKDIRKKFKLPAEGDVLPQGQGIVKETCKGSGKNLGVTKDERIDIVRMTDNPKGKWLIRNKQGEYGYVESDKVTIDVNQLRQTFGVGGMAPSGIASGPPVPPGIIPTSSADDDDAIYDQTADEDIYEEV